MFSELEEPGPSEAHISKFNYVPLTIIVLLIIYLI